MHFRAICKIFLDLYFVLYILSKPISKSSFKQKVFRHLICLYHKTLNNIGHHKLSKPQAVLKLFRRPVRFCQVHTV